MRQLIIFLSLVIAGCSAEHSRNATLLKAEQLMSQHPDSAINLLAAINTDSLTTEADSAYYGLLFTEAVHAGGIVMGDDSLIARSHTYYKYAPSCSTASHFTTCSAPRRPLRY